MRDLIVGLIFLSLGAWGIIAWWEDFGELLRGVIPLLLVLVGLAAIGAGFQRTMRDAEHEDESLEKPGAGAIAQPED